MASQTNNEFYDGAQLLSKQDLRGMRPEIFLSTTNRSGGKTTYFNRLVTNGFKKHKRKFGLIYRFNYELDDCAGKFFKDIQGLFFPGDVMESKRRASGIYHELFLNEESCGYALSLNSADQLKKYSHFFSDIHQLVFDEFQSESNRYCDREVQKYISIHTSISRGQGKQVRYVPVYMIANQVSILNPYYVEMGIASRLNQNVNFLRGNGYVLENGFIESASKQQMESGFNQAFAGNSYVSYSSQNVYLNDSMSFIEKVNGKNRYLATIRCGGVDFAIREYAELGILYCDTSVDYNFKQRITVTTEDHQVNYVMLKNNAPIITAMRFYFDHGCFRFKDLRCKQAVLNLLSY